jgi:hypothetical protein
MHPKWLSGFAAAALAVTMSACGYWENASVTISYEVTVRAEAWHFPKAKRENVEAAFKVFSEQNGYQCRPNIKHAEELTCHGPKDLYLAFRPALNKPEFIATFSWVDSSDRTHAEFVHLVAQFRAQMSTVVGDQNVQVKVKT